MRYLKHCLFIEIIIYHKDSKNRVMNFSQKKLIYLTQKQLSYFSAESAFRQLTSPLALESKYLFNAPFINS